LSDRLLAALLVLKATEILSKVDRDRTALPVATEEDVPSSHSKWPVKSIISLPSSKLEASMSLRTVSAIPTGNAV